MIWPVVPLIVKFPLPLSEYCSGLVSGSLAETAPTDVPAAEFSGTENVYGSWLNTGGSSPVSFSQTVTCQY